MKSTLTRILAIPFFCLAIAACGNNSETESGNADSMNAIEPSATSPTSDNAIADSSTMRSDSGMNRTDSAGRRDSMR